VRLPPANARPEAWDEVYKQLGRPDSPDGYEITPPPLPEGVTLDEGETKGFLQHAHKLGLNTRQAQEVLNYYGDYLARGQEALVRQHQQTEAEAEAELQAEYGPITYERNVKTARAMFHAEGDPGLIDELINTGLGNHPRLARFIFRIANEYWKPDQMAQGMKEEDFTGMPSPQAAKEEALRLMAEGGTNKGPYWDKNHALHAQYTSKVARLLEIAEPNQRRPE
jgi:hypothetical protein